MSSICTAEEIAEKKRIAQERLKQKLAASKSRNVISPSNNSVSNSTNSVLSAKVASNFYKKNETALKTPNFTTTNLKNPIQNNQNSYKKFISVLPKQINNNEQENLSSVDTKVFSLKAKTFSLFQVKIKCEVAMVSDTRFVIKPSKYHEQLINVFKLIPTKQYDPKTRLWTFDISDYDLLQSHVEHLKSEVELDQIPTAVLKLFRQPKEELDFSYLLPSIEPKLAKSLLEFQKEGVGFGISKKGRVLIADEMGLGKTLQALAIADYYKEDWPVLITTNASTRSSWFNHAKEYLPSVNCHHIVTLNSADFYIYDAKIVITSYTLMEKHIEKFLDRQFRVLIFDESHHLKSFDAKRTKNAEKLAAKASRIILLSGTPALSKPVELYCQIKMIDKNFMPFKVFSQRYCDGKQSSFGWDSSGQSNLPELNAVLTRKFMIRRLKSEVLLQLAEKNRETVQLNPDLIKLSEEVKKDFNNFDLQLSQGKLGNNSKELLLTYYAKTAEIKAKAVCDYLKSLIKEKKKFIIFAHHKIMMNTISDFLAKYKVDFIRIDGTTKAEFRDSYVKKFQTKNSCKIALLSIHACNAGITLTAADLVIFAELDWNPSTLAQAESRAHRIGQENTVTCRYLIAENTADTIIWKMLKDKQDVLKNAGLFSDNLQNGEQKLAPTSNETLDKYFTPTKRKVEDFYGSKSPSDIVSEEKLIPAKKKKENANEIVIAEKTPNKIIIKDDVNITNISEKITDNKSPNTINELILNDKVSVPEKQQATFLTDKKTNEYDHLFNELDDKDIPCIPALAKNINVRCNENKYDELFNEMEDADFVDLNF